MVNVVIGVNDIIVNKPLPIPYVPLQLILDGSDIAVTTLFTMLAQQYSQDVTTGVPTFVVNVKESVPVGVFL
jgi:hypothetical protein